MLHDKSKLYTPQSDLTTDRSYTHSTYVGFATDRTNTQSAQVLKLIELYTHFSRFGTDKSYPYPNNYSGLVTDSNYTSDVAADSGYRHITRAVLMIEAIRMLFKPHNWYKHCTHTI